MTNVLVGIILTVIAMLAMYWAVHRYFPGLGTLWTNAVTGFGLVVAGLPQAFDSLQGLPWASVISAEHAAKVLFSISIGSLLANGVMRLNNMRVTPPAPPAA